MFTIAVDFDGTIADHRFPDIGEEVPQAFAWLRLFKGAGVKLILWTMRSDSWTTDEKYLSDAVKFCRDRGIEFDGVNANPSQLSWTSSPKAYANLYIDDTTFGCPLRQNPRAGGRPYVDWSIVGPIVWEMAKAKMEAKS